jgi:ethanolamine utilization protein EutQ (cupin superfamily)
MTSMKLILRPTRIRAAGNKTKIIEELVGRVNSQTSALSVARMRSPEGWLEPGQRPEFDEVTLVLRGRLILRSKRRRLEVREGQAVIVKKGEWVQYSTPEDTDYISICYPAFSPDLVHRDEK